MNQPNQKINKIKGINTGMVLAPPPARAPKAPPPEPKTVIHRVQVEETVPLDLEAELARLMAENQALKAGIAKGGGMALKVSEKKAVSVYGIGRFPVTLYPAQMIRFLEKKDEILAFIEANKGNLSWEKVDKTPEEKARQEAEIKARREAALKGATAPVVRPVRHAAR